MAFEVCMEVAGLGQGQSQRSLAPLSSVLASASDLLLLLTLIPVGMCQSEEAHSCSAGRGLCLLDKQTCP